MNSSSGIKRGLAVSAISALAVAGLPLLASSASAAVGDSIAVGSVGPTLNGGSLGGVVVFKTKGVDPAKLALANTALTGGPNSPTQTVSIVGTPTIIANGAAGDSNKTDGLDEITANIKVTTPAAGDTATFAAYEDENANSTVDAAEARTNVSMTTSGVLSKIDVSPASQSAAQGIESGDYTVTLKDAAGRTTQLNTGEQITLTPPATVSTNESGNVITATEIELGTDTFTATGTDVGSYDIPLASNTTPAVNAKATLVVTKAASITADEVDIVTGADSWDGFGGGTNGGTTAVRVDQGTIRIDIDGGASDANSTVTLNLAGTGITFGGKSTATVSTVLDANGNGSLTITPDAGTVQEGDSITVSGSFNQTLHFERSAPDAIVAADPVFSKVGGTVDVTATVVDQFGQPVTTGYVTAQRTGPNAAADTTPQKKAVGSDGKVTFTFTDTKATNGQTENVDFEYFPDQFANASTLSGSTDIKYTTDGMGSNFKTSLEGVDTEGATYDASDVSVVPLADTHVNAANEAADLEITNVESGSDMTVSVDNGALILEPGETELSQGSASVTDVADNFGPGSGYQIIGTKSGLVTVTITSAGRTETAQFTVLAESNTDTARNVTVSGPAEVPSGTSQVTYTAVVTDAFGNGIAGYPVNWLNVQVSGPGQFQDSDAVTNANGQAHLNVRLDSDAAGDVTIRVQGLYDQFGAAADHLYSDSSTKDGKGLPASSDVATATTMVDAAPAGPVAIEPAITGKHVPATDTLAGYDRIVVRASAAGADAVVKLYRVKDGVAKRVKSKDLGADGKAIFKRADLNGDKNTYYYATVGATSSNLKGTTDTIGIR